MPNFHFISYSRTEAKDFVLRLCDDLENGEPQVHTWLDIRDIPAGGDWDDAIAEAIKTCETLIFVMTPDSLRPESQSRKEWDWSRRYKKPVIPLLLDPSAGVPMRLYSRPRIDCTGDYETALASVRSHLRWRVSPEGVLQTLRDRLVNARIDFPNTVYGAERARFEADIDELTRQITDQQQLVDHPEQVSQRVEETITRGIERERQPAQPVRDVSRTRFINPLPDVAPFYFLDCNDETRLVGEFLRSDAQRLITVVGHGWISKIVMVHRLLNALEHGQLSGDGDELQVNGFVFLSTNSNRPLTLPHLFADLCRRLPGEEAERLEWIYRAPKVTIDAKVRALLAEFPADQRPTVLLLDSFENLVSAETSQVTDAELMEALRAVLEAPPHSVKVVIITNVVPKELELVEPAAQVRLGLDEGLMAPFFEDILREMAPHDKSLLCTARERTRGNPRALEALFAILCADPAASLEELLAETAGMLPGNAVKYLVSEAFSRLDPAAQQVMQALAIYGRPVTPAAVDYLLQPFLAGVNSARILGRLVNMQFARKEDGRYYLHPVDRAYALSRIDQGNEVDHRSDPLPFTRLALLQRAADYFQQVRTPRETWKKLEDLAPQLAEFELRYAAHDFDTAAKVLLEIDGDYLLLWGHFRLVTGLHERLRGKLDDKELDQASAGILGTAYRLLGRAGSVPMW